MCTLPKNISVKYIQNHKHAETTNHYLNDNISSTMVCFFLLHDTIITTKKKKIDCKPAN